MKKNNIYKTLFPILNSLFKLNTFSFWRSNKKPVFLSFFIYKIKSTIIRKYVSSKIKNLSLYSESIPLLLSALLGGGDNET